SQLVFGQATFTVNDVCENDSSVFINKSQNSSTYLWKFGDGEYSTKISPKHLYIINGVSQTFVVTLVSFLSGGGSDSISKHVTVNSKPISDFTYTFNNKTIACWPSQAGNTSYRWLFGDRDSSSLFSPTHTFRSPPYTVCLKVTNATGCTSENCITIKIGTATESKNSEIKLFPNPSKGNLTVEIENPEKDISIEVYNSMGVLVKKVEKVGKEINIYLEVASGIYLVKVRNGDVVYSQKVSVAK
ncbi:MAG: PKD domain-containing protein, partial [Bacteroidia bacterium]